MVGVGGGTGAFGAGGLIMSDWNSTFSAGSHATRTCSLCGFPRSTCSSMTRLFVSLQLRAIGDCLERGFLAGLREPIANQIPRCGPGLLVERHIRLMRDDGCTVIDEGAQPARVIEVHMRVDHEPDRLVRDHLLHFGEHDLRPRFVLRPFDDDDVIAHVGGKAVMRSARNPEESIGHLLRRRGHRRWSRRIPDLVRHSDVHEDVRLNRGDSEVERRMSTLRLDDARGELNAAEVAIARVGGDNLHVTEHVVGEKSGHALDLVHLVDQRDDRIAASDGEGQFRAVGDVAYAGIAGGGLDRVLEVMRPTSTTTVRRPPLAGAARRVSVLRRPVAFHSRRTRRGRTAPDAVRRRTARHHRAAAGLASVMTCSRRMLLLP